jgi:hypothetical protein
MELFNMFGQMGLSQRLSLLVTLFPLAAGVAYVIRPTEPGLALMRPISLAGIFSGLAGAVLALMNVLEVVWDDNPDSPSRNHGASAGRSRS